jgi:hypothetical protein
MNRMDDPLQLVTDLAPAMLDQLADDGYARHRHGDLARMAAEGPGDPSSARGRRQFPAGRGRPRRLLMTGGVAVTAAAAAAAVVLAGAPPASRPQTPPPGAVPGAHQSARSFLLATAVIAARAPATTGTYWYTKERSVQPTVAMTRNRKYFLPGITYTATEESWSGQVRSRSIVDENLRFSFASAADRARWQALGEPPLMTADGTNTKPSTSNYHMTFRYGPGYRLTLAGIERLPATAAGLGTTLRRMWNSIAEKDRAGVVGFPHPTFGQYLVQWADTLLTGPATPGTRAAMYQLLARQPGIRIIPSVTDPLGRTGVAVADGGGNYLVIDPQTARELASTSFPVHANSTIAMTSGVGVWEAMGWTNQLGVPPRS